jgi:uncharacterized OB-fold protein
MSTQTGPFPDAMTAPFWEHAKAGAFALPRCEDCGRHHFYPRPACPHCGGESITWVQASGHGKVYSYSVVHRAPGPAFADDVPYVVAIIATDEGPHLLSRVVEIAPEDVRIGLPVRVRFDAPANDILLPTFEPAEAIA